MQKQLASYVVCTLWTTVWLWLEEPVIAAIVPSIAGVFTLLWSLFAAEHNIRDYGMRALSNKRMLMWVNVLTLGILIVWVVSFGFVPVLIAAALPLLLTSIAQLVMYRRVGTGY